MRDSDKLRDSGKSCAACGGAVERKTEFVDYSTTRGPMTAYEVLHCVVCDESRLAMRSAQSVA